MRDRLALDVALNPHPLMAMVTRLFQILVCGLVLACFMRVAGAAEPDFVRDVRPILSNHCFKCHGPDEGTREADLRLDTAEGALADLGGYSAVDPEDPDSSALLDRITTTDPDLRMPPDDSGLELTPKQVELLRRWVKSGGKYEEHWAFRALRQPSIPAGQADPASSEDAASERQPSDSPSAPTSAAAVPFGRGAIDRFVRRKLRELDLEPSPPASRSTLIRRVHLDLLGLPPSPAAVKQFLSDASPMAYERMVDGVLANPHFGERWGRHWLDQARYADTNGYTVDSARSMWPYRDWVIQALNADMPFDDFTIEQLAGDLLAKPTQDQLVATGFHRNTLINQEGGTDREQFRNEAVVDRVNTTGAVWLGLTVGCAQCHTHKYDPISQHEYYRLFAFFNSTQDVNSVAPTISVVSERHRNRLNELDQKITQAKAALKEFDRQRNERLKQSEQDDGRPFVWSEVRVESIESAGGAEFGLMEDGSVLATGENADSDVYTIKFNSPVTRISAVRIQAFTHPSLPQGGPGRAGNGNFVLNELGLKAGSDATAKWLHATADHSQRDYPVTSAVDGKLATGWAIGGTKNANVTRTARFVLEPLQVAKGESVTLTMEFTDRPPKYNLGRFRLSVTDAPLAKLDLPDPERVKLAAAVKRATDARAAYAKSLPSTMVMRELDRPRKTSVLIRGDFLRRGDAVLPDTPACLPPLPAGEPPRSRLDLAEWLVDGQNPLTARVAVNRIWMHLFGRGLVETENDFGIQGTPPTHPELLDWLSLEFMRNDWSVKRLIRQIVTSDVYRQSSAMRPEVSRLDPLNKRLGRQSRIRVDAEVVRDLALSAAGLLNRRVGGKSVYPPQPSGVYAFTQRNAGWPTSKGADRFRRGMYTFFMRSAPHPMLTTFDVPAFNTTCTRRVRSNTPLQALTIANDEAFVEAAQHLGRRLAASRTSTNERLELAFHLCLSRAPTAEEGRVLAKFVAGQSQEFAESLDDARVVSGLSTSESSEVGDEATVEQATWTVVARILLNLDEFITRE